MIDRAAGRRAVRGRDRRRRRTARTARSPRNAVRAALRTRRMRLPGATGATRLDAPPQARRAPRPHRLPVRSRPRRAVRAARLRRGGPSRERASCGAARRSGTPVAGCRSAREAPRSRAGCSARATATADSTRWTAWRRATMCPSVPTARSGPPRARPRSRAMPRRCGGAGPPRCRGPEPTNRPRNARAGGSRDAFQRGVRDAVRGRDRNVHVVGRRHERLGERTDAVQKRALPFRIELREHVVE